MYKSLLCKASKNFQPPNIIHSPKPGDLTFGEISCGLSDIGFCLVERRAALKVLERFFVTDAAHCLSLRADTLSEQIFDFVDKTVVEKFLRAAINSVVENFAVGGKPEDKRVVEKFARAFEVTGKTFVARVRVVAFDESLNVKPRAASNNRNFSA